MQNKVITTGIRLATGNTKKVSGVRLEFTPEKLSAIRRAMIAAQEHDFDYVSISSYNYKILDKNGNESKWCTDCGTLRIYKGYIIFYAQEKEIPKSQLESTEVGVVELGIVL